MELRPRTRATSSVVLTSASETASRYVLPVGSVSAAATSTGEGDEAPHEFLQRWRGVIPRLFLAPHLGYVRSLEIELGQCEPSESLQAAAYMLKHAKISKRFHRFRFMQN